MKVKNCFLPKCFVCHTLKNRDMLLLLMIVIASASMVTFTFEYNQSGLLTLYSIRGMTNVSQFNGTTQLPVIYIITPTYRRVTQVPDLTRLAQTLMHVKQIHWIVVEDAAKKSDFVIGLLNQTRLNATHLNIQTSGATKV